MEMSFNDHCPVPYKQRPLAEYCAFTESWFFNWPLNKSNKFYRSLIISWILFFPFVFIISSGSITLKGNFLAMLLVSLIISLFSPLFLIIRQLIGWDYILKRLSSDKVEYEKSGWYDGEIWEKPLNWRQKDLLIAQHEVKPIIQFLIKALYAISSIIILSGLTSIRFFIS